MCSVKHQSRSRVIVALPSAVSQCCFEHLDKRWYQLCAACFAEFSFGFVANWIAQLLSLLFSKAVADSGERACAQ
jgi:hypothetical protein